MDGCRSVRLSLPVLYQASTNELLDFTSMLRFRDRCRPDSPGPHFEIPISAPALALGPPVAAAAVTGTVTVPYVPCDLLFRYSYWLISRLAQYLR